MPTTYKLLIGSEGGFQIILPSPSLIELHSQIGGSIIFNLELGLLLKVIPVILSGVCTEFLNIYSKSPVFTSLPCLCNLIRANYSAIAALLNLLSPSNEKASSAL